MFVLINDMQLMWFYIFYSKSIIFCFQMQAVTQSQFLAIGEYI